MLFAAKKKSLAKDFVWLQQQLKWLYILYDNEEKENEKGDMAWFLLRFAKMHPDIISASQMAKLQKIEKPIKYHIEKDSKTNRN